MKRLLHILGDQLDERYLDHVGFDAESDAVLMVEAGEESKHVPSHKQRTVLFLSAMRHFAQTLEERGVTVHYVRLDDVESTGTLDGELRRHGERLGVGSIVAVRPGEHRVLRKLCDAAEALGADFELVEDPHFFDSPKTFDTWVSGRKELVLEHYYRHLRKREGILLDDDGKPEGGQWNFDQKNREPLRDDAPVRPEPLRFAPDEITREVLEMVERELPDLPGRVSEDTFGWPVTREQAEAALDDFIEHRLPHFGTYQDAMKTGEPWLFHSLLSPALNLKLLDPRDCLERAVQAWESGHAPIHCVEGFVRQILGWREFIRGVYWREGPDYETRNHLEENGRLPEFYWTGDSDMVCLSESVGQVLDHAYGHHIQRLMVTGNFALLLGVHPKAISDWYLGMYVDAVDWVTLPNTLGMVMHADGGVVGTKPYASTGKYVQRMSDYCSSCRFDPAKRHGDGACPFTTLYWDFLARHRERFEGNRRMTLMYGHVNRMDESELAAIRSQADELRHTLTPQPEDDPATAR